MQSRWCRKQRRKIWLERGRCCKETDYLDNRRRFWKKVEGEVRAPMMNDSVETKDGELLTDKEAVQGWREHFSELFQCVEKRPRKIW